jgi:cell division initiation protein
MERIAPIEIDHQNLKIALKGYDRSEVDVLVQRMKTEMSSMLEELKSTKEEVDSQKVVINRLVAQENTIKEALLVAQRAAEGVRSSGQKDADEMISKAREHADDIRKAAEDGKDAAKQAAEAIINDARTKAEEIKKATDEAKASAQRDADALVGQTQRLADEMQKAAEEAKASAQREADAIIAQAHRTAEETQQQYQGKINDLRWELERTRMDRQKFVNEFRSTLEGYLRGLTEEPGNFQLPPPPVEPSENIKAAIDAVE